MVVGVDILERDGSELRRELRGESGNWKQMSLIYFLWDYFSPDWQRHAALELRIRTWTVILLIIVIASLNIIMVSGVTRVIVIGVGLVGIMLFSLVDTQVPSRSQRLRVKCGVISHSNPNGNISIFEGNSPEIILLTGHH